MFPKIFFVVCLFCCIAVNISTSHADQHRRKRNILEGLKILAEITSNLRKAYDNNELTNANDVALNVVKSVPIIGDIVHMATENPGSSNDEKMALNYIYANLNKLNQVINNVGNKVEELSKEIELSVLKNQVANANRVISNCYLDFLLLLENVGSKANLDRVENCYFKFEYVQEIGSLLQNKKLTFMQSTLFDQIIDENGHCDGRDLNDVYRYLLGLYFQGCAVVVTAEILKYGRESVSIRYRCVHTFELAWEAHQEIYAKCAQEPCDKIVNIMEEILWKENTSEMVSNFHKVFPWFNILVVVFKNENSSGVTFYGGNHISLSSKGEVSRVLIWSSHKATTSGKFRYGISYNTDTEYFKINELGLSESMNENSTKTSLIGHSEKPLKCKNGVKSENAQPEETVNLLVKISIIAGSSIGALLSIFGIWKLWKCFKTCNDDEWDDE